MKQIVFLFLFLSCTSQTLIKTGDDVKIYIDGDFKARGSYLLRDTKIIFSQTEIALKREGCQDEQYFLKKNEKLNYKSLLMSFLLLPMLWLMEYEESHQYDFKCIAEKN